VSWTAPADDGGSTITSYTVEYATSSSGPWTTHSTNLTTTRTITGLSNGTQYYVRVRANNGAGSSAWVSSTATPITTPTSVTGFTATAGVGEIDLNWSAPSSNGGSAITGYRVQYATSGSGPWTTDSTNLSTSRTITGLTNGTQYFVRVRALNAAGDGALATLTSTPLEPLTLSYADTSFTGGSNNQTLAATTEGGLGDRTYSVSGTLPNGVTFDEATGTFTGPGSGAWETPLPTQVGGSDDDESYGVALDTRSNIYITGEFSGTASFGATSLTSAGGDDVFVAKLDAYANWQWAKRVSGTSTDAGHGVAVDSSGNPYITGYFRNTASFGATSLTSAGSDDVFVAKLDSNGNWQWAKRAGGTSTDRLEGIAVDSDNDVYITGYFRSTASFGATNLTASGQDVFVAKLDSNGNWQWAERAGGSSWDERGEGVAVDSGSNVYVTGYFQGTASFGATSLTSDGSDDVFVAKLNGNGNWQWAERAGGTDADVGEGVAVDSSGNTYLTGRFQGTADFGSNNLDSSSTNNVNYTGGGDVRFVFEEWGDPEPPPEPIAAFVAKLDTNGDWDEGLSLPGLPATVDVTVTDDTGSTTESVTLTVGVGVNA